jgi:hypothetical protein
MAACGPDKRTVRCLWRFCFAVLWAVAIAGCHSDTARAAEREPRYPMWDSGVQVGNSSPPFWVNDTTLFFPGFPSGQRKGPFEALQRSLYLWDIGGKPQRHAVGEWAGELPDGAWYCAAKGRVHYLIRSEVDPQQRGTQQKVGIPGEEVVRPSERRGYEQPLNVAGLAMCERNFDPAMAARSWAVDSNGEYYLDFGPRRQAEPEHTVQLRKIGENLQVDLPLQRSQAAAFCAGFLAFHGNSLFGTALEAARRASAQRGSRAIACRSGPLRFQRVKRSSTVFRMDRGMAP